MRCARAKLYALLVTLHSGRAIGSFNTCRVSAVSKMERRAAEQGESARFRLCVDCWRQKTWEDVARARRRRTWRMWTDEGR